LSPAAFVHGYRWATEQHELFPRYSAFVVASEHMKREYVRNGVQPSRVHVNPLFPTNQRAADRPWPRDTDAGVTVAPGRTPVPAAPPDGLTVAFVGRMTALKGGELLVDAAAQASARLKRPVRLILIGDGPQRSAWEQRAADRKVAVTSTGWLDGDARWPALRQASLLALPSTWPEPFGLVGLEAASLGIPAVAFDVGGIREWLRPGVNGYLAAADPPRPETLAGALVDALGDLERLKAMGCRAIGVAREMSLDRHLDGLDAVFTQHAHPAGR
jgi:glycosyltransferase involved in cell wall biosynthesis